MLHACVAIQIGDLIHRAGIASVDAERTLLQVPVTAAIGTAGALCRSDKLRAKHTFVLCIQQVVASSIGCGKAFDGAIVIVGTGICLVRTIVVPVAPQDTVVDIVAVCTADIDTSLVGTCRIGIVVHHGDISQVAVRLQIDTTTTAAAGVIAYQDIVHVCTGGIDTAAVTGSAVACDNRIGDACRNIVSTRVNTATSLCNAVHYLEVVDLHAIPHQDATAVAGASAITDREAIPQGCPVGECGALCDDCALVLAVEDGGMGSDVALIRVVVLRLVAGKSAIDINIFLDGEAAIIGTFGHPNLKGRVVYIVVGFCRGKHPIKVAGSVAPRRAVARALGGHIVATQSLGQCSEADGTPQRGVAGATDGTGAHRISGVLAQVGQQLVRQ